MNERVKPFEAKMQKSVDALGEQFVRDVPIRMYLIS